GIMRGEEHAQQVTERQFGGGEFDSGDLDMARVLAAHLLIAGVVDVPAAVAGQHALHAAQIDEDRFDAPEAAAAKDGNLIAWGWLFCHDNSSLIRGHAARPTSRASRRGIKNKTTAWSAPATVSIRPADGRLPG